MDESTYGHKYNLQHIVLYQNADSKSSKNQNIIKPAIYQIAAAYKIEFKEFAFDEDFAPSIWK